ncbi:hypothetical protein FKM82_024109 [Ascaphus truei]
MSKSGHFVNICYVNYYHFFFSIAENTGLFALSRSLDSGSKNVKVFLRTRNHGFAQTDFFFFPPTGF